MVKKIEKIATLRETNPARLKAFIEHAHRAYQHTVRQDE